MSEAEEEIYVDHQGELELIREADGLWLELHTAIVPTRKDRIGRSLGNFVQKHFLTREVLTRHLSGLQIARRVTTCASSDA
jgi:uncharacterized membrane-anchored protein YjiN (DUF445 family)